MASFQTRIMWPGSNNRHATLALLMYVQQTAIGPDLTFSDILRLNIDVNATYEVVTLVAMGLKTIWDRRKEGKTVSPIHIKAEVEARKYILLKSCSKWLFAETVGA